MESVAAPSERRRVWLAALVIVTAAVAAYHNTFSVPLLLDDLQTIADNPSIRDLSRIGAVFSPPPEVGAGGRPLANASFALNYALGGTSVGSYHAVNLALHAAAALALFGLVRRTVQLPAIATPFHAHATPLAAAGTLLWTLHPAHTAAITYLTQRMEAMMALGYFLTLYALVRAVKSGAPRRWLSVSVAACWAGALSKEIIATAPVAALLYDRAFLAGSFAGAWRARKIYYLGLAATWVILAVLMQDVGSRGGGFTPGVDAWSYALTSCRSLVTYAALALWPNPLVFDHGTTLARTLGAVWPQALLVLAALAATLLLLSRRPRAGFPAAMCFLVLAPTTSFIPLAGQPIGEHRMYVPLAAFAVAVLLILVRAIGRHTTALVACLGMAGGVLTVARNRVYATERALWTDTAAKAPANARAHATLGNILLADGETAAALRAFETALRADPRDADAHLGLGNVLLVLDRAGEAVTHYEFVTRARPQFAEGHYNLGNALLATGARDAAIGAFERASALPFANPELHHRLGEIFLRLKRHDRAIAHYRQSLSAAPAPDETAALERTLDAHLKLGALLAETNPPAAAVQHLEAALRLRPDDAETHEDLGLVFERLGRTAEARRHLEHALRLKPSLPRAAAALARLPRS